MINSWKILALKLKVVILCQNNIKNLQNIVYQSKCFYSILLLCAGAPKREKSTQITHHTSCRE